MENGDWQENIEHRTSNIEHPTSNIQHPTPNIECSCFPYIGRSMFPDFCRDWMFDVSAMRK